MWVHAIDHLLDPLWEPTSQESPHLQHLTFKTVPVLPSLDPSLIFPFLLLPSPVHSTGFSFLNSLPFLSCCHRTTAINYHTFISDLCAKLSGIDVNYLTLIVVILISWSGFRSKWFWLHRHYTFFNFLLTNL